MMLQCKQHFGLAFWYRYRLRFQAPGLLTWWHYMITLQPLYMYIHIYIRTCILPGISLIREKRYMCCVTVYLVYKSMLIAVCEWIVVGQCQTISYNFVRKLREAWWYRNSAFYINDEKRWLCCNDNKLSYYRRHITYYSGRRVFYLSPSRRKRVQRVYLKKK